MDSQACEAKDDAENKAIVNVQELPTFGHQQPNDASDAVAADDQVRSDEDKEKDMDSSERELVQHQASLVSDDERLLVERLAKLRKKLLLARRLTLFAADRNVTIIEKFVREIQEKASSVATIRESNVGQH